MSWIVVLIMLLVFAMMIGPVLLLKPNRRQLQIADLRQEATRFGLRVELQKVGDRNFAVYEIRWPKEERQRFAGPEWVLDKLAYQHEIHFAGVWQWRDGNRAPEALQPLLRQSLGELPDTVHAVAATKLGLGVYWTEAGGSGELARINSWLRRYAGLMSPYIHQRPE